MQDLYTQWCRKKANRIIIEPNYPNFKLSCLLPVCRQYLVLYQSYGLQAEHLSLQALTMSLYSSRTGTHYTLPL